MANNQFSAGNRHFWVEADGSVTCRINDGRDVVARFSSEQEALAWARDNQPTSQPPPKRAVMSPEETALRRAELARQIAGARQALDWAVDDRRSVVVLPDGQEDGCVYGKRDITAMRNRISDMEYELDLCGQ